MSTNTPQHTISSIAGLKASFDACVSIGQVRTTITSASRPAVVGLLKDLGAYEGHSRDHRDELDTVLVAAYAATRPDIIDQMRTDDADLIDGEWAAHSARDEAMDRADTADLVTTSRTAHEADVTRNRQENPNPMTVTTPTAAEHDAGRNPRKNGQKTFVAADHPDGYTCVGRCGEHKPVKAFFPTVKGGAVRTQECTKCMDTRRAEANPESGIARQLREAEAKRAARAAARQAEPEPAPVTEPNPTDDQGDDSPPF